MSLLALALAVLLPWMSVHAQGAVSPQELKAAFLFRFASFVEWPEESKADEAIVFGIVDAEEVEVELRRNSAARAIGGKPTVVRQVATPADLAGVHVLFVGSRDSVRAARWISQARQLPILVVTDVPDGLERGSILNFITTDRVQFEASTDAAARAGLRLSPRLLSVAIRVKKGEADSPVLLAARRRPRPA